MQEKNKEIVITGMGLINPMGYSVNDYWQKMKSNIISISPTKTFDCSDIPIKLTSEITDFDYKKIGNINKRLINKIDKFTHLALVSAEQAIIDAKLDINEDNADRIGVYYGNNSGGWDICQKGYDEYYNEGPTFVNKWQATAWFPAAAQGYISIVHGIKGQSKSFIDDRLSGAHALYFAIDSIRSGRNDIVVVGGSEAPITKLGLVCYADNGCMSFADSTEKYLQEDKLVLAEGSACLILEEHQNAVKRNAKIYGKIIDYDSRKLSVNLQDEFIDEYVKQYNYNNSLNFDNVSIVIPENISPNSIENKFIQKIIKHKKYDTFFSKRNLGHLYGGSTATDVINAIQLINNSSSRKKENVFIFSRNENNTCISFIIGGY